MATARQILAGPSKMDLQNALFMGSLVEFTVEGLGKMRAQVTLVEQEDGSMSSWNIDGQLICGGSRNNFQGYYHTVRRTGNMKVAGKSSFCQHCGKEQTTLGRCKHCDE